MELGSTGWTNKGVFVLTLKQRVNAYERKIIHNKLSTWKTVKTYSVGEEPNRTLIIEYNPNGQVKKPNEHRTFERKPYMKNKNNNNNYVTTQNLNVDNTNNNEENQN